MAKSCNFDIIKDCLIRDRVVTGIICDITRRKPLQDPSLTLTKAIDIARAMEASKGQMTKLKNEEEAEQIHKLQRSTAPTYNKGSMKRCHFCNKAHLFKKRTISSVREIFQCLQR